MARHDLLILTEDGQERALLEAGIADHYFLMEKKKEYEKFFEETWCIPAIVRKQERDMESWIDTGFSFPWFENGQRIRLSGRVLFREIVKKLSPFDVMKVFQGSLENQFTSFLKELINISSQYGISLGVYGSAALEMVSGLPYLHEASDIDLIMKAFPVSEMEQCYWDICNEARKFGIKADMEIRLEQIGDVKAQELFSKQKTLMVRGEKEIFLWDREKMENTINILTNTKI